MNHSKIKEVVAELMQQKGLNETTLAEATKITQPTAWRIMKVEGYVPKLDTLCKLASYFNVTVSQLIGETPLETYKPNIVLTAMQKLPDYKIDVLVSTALSLLESERKKE